MISEEADKPPESVSFTVSTTTGDARRGELRVGNSVLETPNLFPVVNFYAGGTINSVYGGGIHRTLKEFAIGADRIGGTARSGYFDAVMTSIASLTDYNITYERYQDYLEVPIKEREIFDPFTGMLFIDSGGYKFLNNDKIDGSNFGVEIDQKTVYEIQLAMGADIIVNLDHPIAPDDDADTRREKARKTAANIEEFLDLSTGFDGARYLTVHGYHYSMLEEYFEEITQHLSLRRLQAEFDGVAMGSLVPKKDNKRDLMRAVSDCREFMDDHGFETHPIHVLGISGRSIPLLAASGADTFDSSAFIHTAINGKYMTSVMETTNVDDAEFTECDCPVCSDHELRQWMQGEAEYQKDALGAIAMHNLIIQKRGLSTLRKAIAQPGTDSLIEYLENTIGQDKATRTLAHQIVNDSLGGYF